MVQFRRGYLQGTTQSQTGGRMSQENDIFQHLYHIGSLTPMEALKKYQVFRLASRIYALRLEGHNIKTIIVENNNKRHAKYILEK